MTLLNLNLLNLCVLLIIFDLFIAINVEESDSKYI